MIKFLSNSLLHKSQLFIALCAAALGTETYLISGTPVSYITIALIFFSSLFIYNAAKLGLAVSDSPHASKLTLQLEGNPLSIGICLVSLITIFCLLTACNWLQVLVFMGTSILSLLYMMPFTRNGVRVKGLRNHLILKNIVLSFTWASATVAFPICLYEYYLTDNELFFMFCRRFFFIYALTVIYDLRDLEADKNAGMATIALRFGEPVTKLWSLMSLAAFVVFVLTDPSLSVPHTTLLSGALLISALAATIITLNTHHIRNKSYYAMLVDSPMVMQYLLVLLFRQV